MSHVGRVCVRCARFDPQLGRVHTKRHLQIEQGASAPRIRGIGRGRAPRATLTPRGGARRPR